MNIGRIIAFLLLTMLLSLTMVAQNGAEALFNQKCATCHGNDGRAAKATKMHVADLQSKAVQQLSDEEMYQTIAEGTQHKEYPHAYLYQGMTKDQIRGLVAYIRKLAKGKN